MVRVYCINLPESFQTAAYLAFCLQPPAKTDAQVGLAPVWKYVKTRKNN